MSRFGSSVKSASTACLALRWYLSRSKIALSQALNPMMHKSAITKKRDNCGFIILLSLLINPVQIYK